MKKKAARLILLEVWVVSFFITIPLWAGETEHEHLRQQHRVVRIDSPDLFPNPLEINTNHAILWVNLSLYDAEVDQSPHFKGHVPLSPCDGQGARQSLTVLLPP